MDQDFKVTQGRFCIDVCADREEAERIAQRAAEDHPELGDVSVVPVPRVELTPEEEAELTPYNCAAFELHRRALLAKDTSAACWLVMSPTAREQVRDRFAIDFLDMTGSKTDLEQLIARKLPADHVPRWREAELYYKKLRIAGNPRAWFCR